MLRRLSVSRLGRQQRRWLRMTINHHREADDLGRVVRVSKGIVHYRRLRELPFRLKPVFSDSAHA